MQTRHVQNKDMAGRKTKRGCVSKMVVLREGGEVVAASGSEDCCSSSEGAVSFLLQLPNELIREHILPKLDGASLVMLELASSAFRVHDPVVRMSWTEAAARDLVYKSNGNNKETSARWRNRSWKERLHLENAACSFDKEASEAVGFRLTYGDCPVHPKRVSLPVMGPKLLVSDLSTSDTPVLRWRLRVKGNTAIEFGVVPIPLQKDMQALHKCLNTPDRELDKAAGFYTQITAGSNLPIKAPVVRGSVVEVVARRGRVEFIIINPLEAKEVQWVNGQPVQRVYRGPKEVRFEQDFPESYDVKLAVTCWAKAAFDVLHDNVDPFAVAVETPRRMATRSSGLVATLDPKEE